MSVSGRVVALFCMLGAGFGVGMGLESWWLGLATFNALISINLTVSESR